MNISGKSFVFLCAAMACAFVVATLVNDQIAKRRASRYAAAGAVEEPVPGVARG